MTLLTGFFYISFPIVNIVNIIKIDTIDRFFLHIIPHCKHRHPYIYFLSVLAGLTVARQISKILVYFRIIHFWKLLLFFVPTQMFLFCPWHKYFLFLPASHRLRVILRFSFPFQFQVLVDADTYKASILIWRISEQSQTCRERQIGMFYPHLKYFWP